MWPGRNEVRRRLGQEASLASPCSKLSSFGSKFTVLKKVLVTLLGFFGDSCSHSATKELRPLCLSSLRSWVGHYEWEKHLRPKQHRGSFCRLCKHTSGNTWAGNANFVAVWYRTWYSGLAPCCTKRVGFMGANNGKSWPAKPKRWSLELFWKWPATNYVLRQANPSAKGNENDRD